MGNSKTLLEDYRGNSTLRNVLTLMTGTTIAQALPIAVSPILTRIYSPGDFGLLALYTSIVALLVVFSTGRYEMAIMLPEKEEDSFNILVLSSFLVTVFSLFLLIITIFFNKPIAGLLGHPKLAKWVYAIPISVFLTGLYQPLNYWVNRKKRYKVLSRSKIGQAISTSILQLGFGSKGISIGLVGGTILGQFLSTGILVRDIQKIDDVTQYKLTYKKMKSQAKIYKKFPLVNSLHALLDNLNNSGTIFIVGYFFNSVVLGQYSLMMRVLRGPIGIIGSAITQVFYEEATRTYNSNGNLQTLIWRLLKKLFLIELIPSFIILFFGPDIFAFVFGENWRVAGEYSRYLIPYIMLSFLASPLAYIPFILSKQTQALIFSLVGNSLYIICIILGSYLKSITISFVTISVLLTIYFVIYIYWILKITTNSKELQK